MLVRPKTRRFLLQWTLVADLLFLVSVTAYVLFFGGRGLLLWVIVYLLLVAVHLVLLLQREPRGSVKLVRSDTTQGPPRPRTVIRRGES